MNAAAADPAPQSHRALLTAAASIGRLATQYKTLSDRVRTTLAQQEGAREPIHTSQ